MNNQRKFFIAILLSVTFLSWSHFCWVQNSELFDSEEILDIRLKGNFNSLFKNTKGEPTYFDFSITIPDRAGNQISKPLKIRTRGHFRREMKICDYPPLLLNFPKKEVEGTVFQGQDKLKLVMPCQGEKYVLREYYVYKLYNLLTPKSFNVRLVRLTMEDKSQKPKDFEPLLVYLIEDEEQMAERNQMNSSDQELIPPERIDKVNFHRMAVFQYLIGNTDWSIQYRQNIKLLRDRETADLIAVPYDFDHAGIVRAPYALPAPELKLSSITDRRYRGYCVEDMQLFEENFLEFNTQKEEIYSLYLQSSILDEKYIKSTVKFFDDFYDIINSPKKSKFDFQYPCQAGGTGNIIIKGLK